MKAGDFNKKEYDELVSALINGNPYEDILNPEKVEVKKFFDEHNEENYNTFLSLYKEKYGNIIKQYRESQKVKAIKIIKVAAVLYIITFILGIIGTIIFLANSSNTGY